MDLVEGNITDHDYPSLVLERIKFLWLSKRLCDATLEAGPVKIYVWIFCLFIFCAKI